MVGKIFVPSRAKQKLSVVEGDLTIGRDAVIEGSGTPPVVKVLGSVYCEGRNIFEGSLEAEVFEGEYDVWIHGNLTVRRSIELEDGHLEVNGNVTAGRVDIGSALYIDGDLHVEEVDIGGSLRVYGQVDSKEIDVGGSFEAKGRVKAERVDVGGNVSIESEVAITKVDVGGTVSVGGGRIGDVDVGGSFESSGALEFGQIDVGGAVRLAGNSKGGDIGVGGSLKADRELEFGSIEVGGKVEIKGSGKGVEMEVGGRVEIDGRLEISRGLEVGGKIEAHDEIVAENIEVGGVLSAKKATAKERIEVGGLIETVQGIFASLIEIGSHGKIRGPAEADQIIVGRDAHVETIRGRKIHMKRGATAENIYGEDITIENGSRINGEIKYTKKLETEGNVSFAKEPQKVTTLPGSS